jgi:hypothetical protein
LAAAIDRPRFHHVRGIDRRPCQDVRVIGQGSEAAIVPQSDPRIGQVFCQDVRVIGRVGQTDRSFGRRIDPLSDPIVQTSIGPRLIDRLSTGPR